MGPTSNSGKLLGLLFIPVTVSAMTIFLGNIANRIAGSADSSEDDKISLPASINKGHFEAMRKDAKDGQAVSNEAFLEYMLLSSGKVNQTFLDEVNTSFSSMDKARKGLLYAKDFVDVMNKADVSIEMKKEEKKSE